MSELLEGKTIIEIHKEISNLKTPKEYIEQNQGIDYPRPEYMRAICLRYFPDTSWTIEEKPVFDSSNKLVAWVVTGTLKWSYINFGLPNIVRVGSMAAAHRIQYKRGTNDILDLGNDVKAANTDCWKKALNFHLNICDDVYRWEDPEVPDIMERIKSIDTEEERTKYENVVKSNPLIINKNNIRGIKALNK